MRTNRASRSELQQSIDRPFQMIGVVQNNYSVAIFGHVERAQSFAASAAYESKTTDVIEGVTRSNHGRQLQIVSPSVYD